jgi:hypothetical protein
MNESDEPLVDAGAICQTGFGHGHDVGVTEGVNHAALEGFLGFRDEGEGHPVAEAHVHKGKALISICVSRMARQSAEGVSTAKNFLSPWYKGGTPGAADGEGLEEAFSTCWRMHLRFCCPAVSMMQIRRVESVEWVNTVWSNTNANANEERVRDRLDLTRKMDLGAEEREFEHSERSGGTQEPQEVPMVTERQAEAPKGAEKAQHLQQLYGVLYGVR